MDRHDLGTYNNFVYFDIGKEYYLLLGNAIITIIVIKTSPIGKTIIVQVEIENNKPIKYSFNQNQTPIKIGRINNSEIPIFSSSISKRHGVIEYSKNIQSFYYKDMGSTNSSTLLVKKGDFLKIKGEMNFKLEDVPFKIQEIPWNLFLDFENFYVNNNVIFIFRASNTI